MTAHGTDIMGYDKWPDLRHFAEDVLKECHSVISISKDNSVLLEERFPDHKNKIILMRNGYDSNIFYPENVSREDVLSFYGLKPEDYANRKIISFAGKLAHFKGVDVLLDAVKLYEDIIPSLTLIIGDGDERDSLHEKADELGLKSVRFLGNVRQEELRRLYNIANVNIVPSRREPFGLVAIEAMACGVPVIATNQGGLPDFVNNSVGKLVDPENARELASAIKNILIREESECNTWRNEIALYARTHYAQNTMIKDLEAVYRSALKNS